MVQTLLALLVAADVGSSATVTAGRVTSHIATQMATLKVFHSSRQDITTRVSCAGRT